MEPKSIKMEPWWRLGASSATLGRHVGSRTLRSESREIKSRLFGGKWCPKGRFWEPFWVQKRSKIDAKIDAEIDAEKVKKMMPKWSKNDAKMDQKGIQKVIFSRKGDFVRNARRSYHSTIWEVQGVQNGSKIYQKSIQNQGSKKSCKNHEK